jgi:hypothetical protein
MRTFIEKLAEESGRKKVDATEALRIAVTKEDIRLGVRGDAECCALALACMRADPRVEGAFFFRTTAWLIYHNKIVRYAMPPHTQAAAVAFDRARAAKPGELSLTPSASRTRSNARRVYENGKYKPRTQVRHPHETRRAELRSFGG